MFIIADTFWKRFKGLAGSVDRDRVLLIDNCRCIHTFGMKYSLDLFWMDERGEVIQRDTHVPPKRIRYCKKAFGVLEFSSQEDAKRKHSGCFLPDTSGQALVETALILPIILLLLFGFLQFGILLFHKQQLLYVNNYSVQEVGRTNNDLRIREALSEYYDTEDGEITIDIQNIQYTTNHMITSSQRRYRDLLTVQLAWDYPLIVPLFSWDSIFLKTQASGRILCKNEVYPYTCE